MDRAYRSAFRPSSLLGAPHICIAVAGACCDIDAEARRVAAAHPNAFVTPNIVGTPDRWIEELDGLVRRFTADEVVVLDLCQHRENRRRTLELLSGTFFPAGLDCSG